MRSWQRPERTLEERLARGIIVGPLVCTCRPPLPDPDPIGECPDCHRPQVDGMSRRNQDRALETHVAKMAVSQP